MDLNLTLLREPSWGGATISQLLCDTEFLCDILEDEVREIPGVPVEEWKIHGETAIPTGHYEIVLVNSPHFGPNTLHLVHVDGFQDVHIHGGNTAIDTHGCLLTGTRNSRNTVSGSQNALKDLKDLLIPLLKAGDRVFLEIIPS